MWGAQASARGRRVEGLCRYPCGGGAWDRAHHRRSVSARGHPSHSEAQAKVWWRRPESESLVVPLSVRRVPPTQNLQRSGSAEVQVSGTVVCRVSSESPLVVPLVTRLPPCGTGGPWFCVPTSRWVCRFAGILSASICRRTLLRPVLKTLEGNLDSLGHRLDSGGPKRRERASS